MASGGVVRAFVRLLETIWRHQSRDIDGLGHLMMMEQACEHTNANKINAWCHGHAFTSERGLLPRPSRCFAAMAATPRTWNMVCLRGKNT